MTHDGQAIAEWVWDSKYRFRPPCGEPEPGMEATWRRVATAVAGVEQEPRAWNERFFDLLSGLRLLPGGRIIAGAGTGRRVTLFNCFVCRPPEDSIESILEVFRETAVTLKQGGGIGIDFSNLRPAGCATRASGGTSSGPVSFMHVWDSLCEVLLSTNPRRGAMMGTLRCDHPDLRAFIDAKRSGSALHNFNLSVQVSDAFMRAVDVSADWPLHHPALEGARPAIDSATGLWSAMAAAAHASAEPGVLFIDRINRENNLHYREHITATNPCGEVPLPPYGACNLGSLNLPRFVRHAFTGKAAVDEQMLIDTVRLAVRFLDDVIELSEFPLPRQAEEARGSRRIGIGVTGLADLLVMLGLHYDSNAARSRARAILELVRDTAYETSVALAREKGAFPHFRKELFMASPFVQRLPPALRASIRAHGIRNSHLLSIAPAGSISLLAGNVSSGIEPVFAWEALRRIRGHDGQVMSIEVRDFAYRQWLQDQGARRALPGYFVCAEELPARAHIDMQAILQPLVDNAISKTVNLPETATACDIAAIYRLAWESGLKGCTVYRTGTFERPILESRREHVCCPA